MYVELFRHSHGESPDPVYSGTATVYVRLREQAYKKHPVGEILEVAIEAPGIGAWATYSESSIEQDGWLNAESYLAALYPRN